VTGTGNERLCFEIYHGKIYFRDDYCLYISTGGNAIQADTWHYVVATYDYPSQQASVYIDGVYKAGDTYFCQASSSLGVLILGRRGTSCEYYLDGIIDEVRFSDTDRGTGWIQTSYSNQSNPSGFYTLGPAECQPSVPAVTTGNATLVEETTATLHGTITDDGGESCQYRFQWGTTQGGPYTDNTTWIGSKTTGQSFSAAITGLGKGTKYYFIAEAKNSTGTDNGTELSFLTKPDPPDPFTATAVSDTRIDLSWVKGDGAENTMVRRKTGTYPASITDGDEVFFDTGTNTSDIGLSPDTTYYYSAWSEVTGSQQWSDAYAAVITTTGSAPPPPPPPTAVGGTVYPVNKAQVLAPWLCFFLVLSLAVGRAVFSLRKMA